jgi:hypothetical protein
MIHVEGLLDKAAQQMLDGEMRFLHVLRLS